MGFLDKTVFAKRLNKTNLFVLAIIAGIISCGLATIVSSSSTFAAEVVDNYGLFTATDGVRWEWEVVSDSENTDEPQKLNLMFYDKPENLTTVTVPSYTDITTVTGVTPISDTYYVQNANQESQDTRFASPDPARRTANQTDVTVLDMTNTSKVQIMGVRPIINPETEVELIFGENMVIGDATITMSTKVHTCRPSYCYYYAYTTRNVTDEDIPNWDTISLEDKARGNVFDQYSCGEDCRLVEYFEYETASDGNGAFANYKLKLTNLDNVKYLGWYAFYNSVFNEDSRTITITSTQTAGDSVFSNTNINGVNIEGEQVFPRMFRGCADLTTGGINFGEATIIGYGAFSDTNLDDDMLDFSNTNIKTIKAQAFARANISSINFEGVETVEYQAFIFNNLTELYLPKSISSLGGGIFYGNPNIKKATVVYDTLTTGTRLQFFSVLDGNDDIGNNDMTVKNHIEEIVVLAPYDTDEVVKDSHITYREYRDYIVQHGSYDAHVTLYMHYPDIYGNVYNSSNQHLAEDTYINTDAFKNVIAPLYFMSLSNIKRITVGEGFEYIGGGAFYDNRNDDGWSSWDDFTVSNNYGENVRPSSVRAIEKVTLPESLKGVGAIVITSVYNPDFEMNIPSGLEFIGFGAFRRLYHLDVDLDLPNLRFMGDYAFFSTKVHDITLRDKIEYMGPGAFNDCPNIHDITFDYDVFNPDGYRWWLSGSTSQSVLRNLLGAKSERQYNKDAAAYYGFNYSGNPYSTYTINSITFTEKATHPIALCEDMMNCYTSMMGFFNRYTINKFDMGKAPWEFVPSFIFTQSYLGEVILPENVKTIHTQAFNDAIIEKELILPEGLEVIEDGAFGQAYVKKELKDKETIKITKLPQSLKKIGTCAFYLDERLVLSDFDLPNLETVGNLAFVGATIERIAVHDTIQELGYGAFWLIKGVKDILIDLDIFNADASFNYNGTPVILGMSPGVYILSGRPYPSGNTTKFESHFDTFEPQQFTNEYGDVYYGYATFVEKTMHSYRSIKFTDKVVTAPGETITNIPVFEPCDNGYILIPETGMCRNEESGNERYASYTYQNAPYSHFYNVVADEIDMSQTNWNTIPYNMFNGATIKSVKLPSTLTSIPDFAFYNTTVEEPVEIPSNVTSVGTEAFQYSNISFSNALPEGVTTIGQSAFYSADIHGDFTIPSTVQSIGYSAFNATETDTHYGTVTIKPALDYAKASNQAIFQLFWNASMDKLVIESPMLPVLGTLQAEPVMPGEVEARTAEGVVTLQPQELRADGEPEFHAMTMREVEIKNLPTITANAFEECANLETVSFANHTNLQEIAQYAFNNDTKLKHFTFGDGLVGKDVALKEYAFNNTAVETIGNHNTDFDLTAANFNTVDEHVFSNMPKLKSVDIPNNFNIDESMADETKNVNGAYITSFTFSDDPELENVTIAYQVAEIRDGAFLNDEKLSKLFIWGNTDIQESDDLIRDFNNTTIPQGTNIFAYSDAPAENYANDDSRSTYDGKFYPLDEVLYLTSNKTYVILEQDEEGNNVDFDKDGLILYALRRDGVILESDDWQNYTTAFTRASNPNIVFEEGRGAAGNLGTDESIMWTVYDAPKPFDLISLANQNYQETNFEFIQMPSSINPLVAIHYPDGYTTAIRTTTLASMTKEEEEEMLRELEVPNTGALQTIVGVAAPSVSIAAIVVLGGIYIARKRKN